ncbi:MAG: S8 family serine peptidase [Cyanobacteria bacterium]|nr:S8 family serine peptidase [Cyanobacteriota bacterium]
MSKFWLRLSSCALALSFLLGSTTTSIAAETESKIKLRTPTRGPTQQTKATAKWIDNTLLVMPFQAQDEETQDLLKEVNGTVEKTIGEGEMTCWVVRFNSVQEFAAAEKKLSTDKKIKTIQRDYILKSDATTSDPYFAQEWHLPALNVPNAWNISLGGNIAIGVIDTGVNTANKDLAGKLYTGYNAMTKKTGQNDNNGHGTMVSTTAAALANGKFTVGPARLAYIYPVCAGSGSGFSTSSLVEAVNHLGNKNVKLINLSDNATPPYSIANPSAFSALHTYFKWFHDTKGGLIFNAAGNEATQDTNPILPYLIVVSAIDQSYGLASFSNYGSPVWFTAPGNNIYCTKGTNTVVSVAGTSFASPLACSIAALVWGAKPSLTNIQVENLMKNHCVNSTSGWNQYYGWGMPDAQAILDDAL